MVRLETAYLLRDSALRRACLEDCFPFLGERGHMLALVGAGGKTTLMTALAQRYSRQGLRTAVTTTTHILRPEPSLCCGSIEDCRALWSQGRWAVWGRDTGGGKLSALDGDSFRLLREADAVLVEADGSKRLPCKVPASHEPQIPPQADIVIGVLGLSALGQTVRDGCFRWEEAVRLLGCAPSHRLTEADFAEILLSGQGTRKGVGGRTYYTVLNQCDNASRLAQGLKILRLLRQRGQTLAALTCFRP